MICACNRSNSSGRRSSGSSPAPGGILFSEALAAFGVWFPVHASANNVNDHEISYHSG
jgi:hypothetical protein